MHEDPLAVHIASLVAGAQPGPAGVFSLDLAGVQPGFSAAGDDWLHYGLRFAAFYGAQAAEIDWDGRRFELRFQSDGPDLEQLRSLLLHRDRGPRYLGLGMLAGLQQGFQQIVLEAPRGTLSLRGGHSQLEENRRSRDGFCRLRAHTAGPVRFPKLEDLMLPLVVNGTQWPGAMPGRGLRLLLDGFAFGWDGDPLLPPGEDLDWPVAEARLDAGLRRLLQPALSFEQIQRLQADFQEQLLRRDRLGPEAVEWLLIRAPAEKVAGMLTHLPAPPAGHVLAPAHAERRLAWLGEASPGTIWDDWPADCWPGLLEQGLAPFSLPSWLRSTCARLPAQPTYAYLLRHSWRGDHFDAAFLQALLKSRPDTLGGNVLLAGQLRLLKPAQRPPRASRFCREFLGAVCQGLEGVEEWSLLSPVERTQVSQLLEEPGF